MSRTYDTVLVIGAEKLSSIVDWKDRNTCVLFGDGAGAAVLQNRPNSHGLLTAVMGADGERRTCSSCRAAAAAVRRRADSVQSRHALPAHGRQRDIQERGAGDAHGGHGGPARCEIDITQIKCIIPHQANRRIIDAVADRLGATPEQLFVNLESTETHPPHRWRSPWMKRSSPAGSSMAI